MSKLNDGITEDWYEQNRKQRLAGMQRDFRLSRADDDLSRGGDPLGLAIAIILCMAVSAILIAGFITGARWAQESTVAPDAVHIVASSVSPRNPGVQAGEERSAADRLHLQGDSFLHFTQKHI